MKKERDRPEIIECELRLHGAPPANGSGQGPTFEDWSATAVGEAVRFRAIAIPSQGAWNGPLPPGAEVAAPRALDDPYWSVFLPASKGAPIISGRVGHPLAIGEAFCLPSGRPGEWTRDLAFEGAIVIR